ncbi:DUF5615 family PIN-like protein [Gloeothece verrucosa]|uniref:DUF5615 family PIN-like protein n=1 Tax=Gloeothece verrucosa TaxID=2546359 RepID=UPI001FE0FCB8|nr:DUF5615 family PIN-like protein [Gloeothece verrucosa]
MKFLVDAQLPVSLARFLEASGYDTIHTQDLPQQNSTSDTQINDISIEQKRIVITKDSDDRRFFSNPSKTLQIASC